MFETEILNLDAMTIAGITQDSDSKMGGFSEAWKRLNKMRQDIKGIKNGSVSYGFETYPVDFREKHQFTYMAAVEVSDIAHIPVQLFIKKVPASEYVAVKIENWNENLGRGIRFLYDEWFPNSGYVAAYPFDFERYDEQSRVPKQEEQVVRFFAPIKKHEEN